MTSFVIYDLVFLFAFTLFVIIFLYARRRNLQRQGIMYLYRTKVGLKVIEWTSRKFRSILKPMQYVVIASGYALMAGIVYLLVKFLEIYLTGPAASQIKIPPLIPLIPYLPELFKLNFLPPFYFTYWIIIIAIVAVSHEFAHGIFARVNNIRVVSTGFGFLGPFLAAFVEPDEKQMEKSSKFSQLAILGAGTFANVLVTIIFGLVLWLFFVSAFVPAGVNFNSYGTSLIGVSNISIAGSVILGGANFTKVESGNISYFVPPENVQNAIDNKVNLIAVYDDAPAIKSGLSGAISEINGEKITNYNALREAILSNKPRDTILIKTIDNKEVKEYNLMLAEKDGKPYLGIGIITPERKGITGFIIDLVAKVKDPLVYYESKIGDMGQFTYDLLWWLVLINISVALMNMLPFGIFDGGRFFYLTVWGITGKERFAKKIFSVLTWVMILIAILIMVRWLFVVL